MRTAVKVEKITTLSGHRDAVYSLEKAGENDLFFSAGGDGMIVAWTLKDPENGELIARTTNSVYALHYLEGRNLLLLGQNTEGVQVIDLVEKKIIKSIALPKVAIFDIISDPDTGKVYVGMGNGAICVLSLETFGLKTQLRKSDQSVRCLALNAKTNELAAGYSDNKIRIFDSNTLELKHELDSHTNSVFSIAYSPEGDLLLSGGRDAHLRVWETENNYSERGYMIAHMYTINHITYSPDGRYFATCSMDKSIKLWDARTFKLLKVIDKVRNASHGTSVNKLFWSAHQNQLVSCSDDRTISVWDINIS